MTSVITRRAFARLVAGIALSAFGLAHAAGKSEKGKWIVNVNEATFDELKTIPGIGDELASDIFRKRKFKDVEDLIRVDGINHRKLEAIRPYVKVKGPTEPFPEKKK